MRTIQITLDPSSIANAIKELNEYKAEIETKTKQLIQRLVDLGANVARVKIVEMGAYYSGELLSGVGGYFSPLLNSGWVKVTNNHAAFVEFGTGVVGLANPHKNGEYRFTEGMKSRPFMYETELELQRTFPKLAMEVFRT